MLILASLAAGSAPALADEEKAAAGEEIDAGPNAAAGKTGADAAFPDITVEGMVIARDKPRSTALTGPFNSQGFTPVTSSGIDGMGDVSAGVKATISARVFDQPVEFSAFHVLPFIAEELKTGLSVGSVNTTPTTSAIYANDPGGDISSYTNSQNIGSLYVKHATKLFGAEANAVDAFNVPGLLLGARTIYYGEELDTVATKLTSAAAQDAVSIQTDNYLIGLQLGLQHMWDIGGGLKAGGGVKAGLYTNQAERTRSFVSRNQTQTRAQQNTLDDSAFAQAFEINPRIEFEIAKGVSLSASGTFLWLSNVSGALPHYATATDLDDRDIRAREDAFFYGATAGLTINLDELDLGAASGGATSNASATVASKGGTPADVEARIAELEAATTRADGPMSVSVYGQVNRMVLGWSDGTEHDVHVVDNVNAPSLFGIEGAARLGLGWTAGYNLEIGVEDSRSNAVSQLADEGEEGEIAIRFADLWLRSRRLGTVTIGETSPATDNIILSDFGGTTVAASPNIALIGGEIILRAADDPDLRADSLITRTTLGDFVGGATLDTFRRDVVRYDTPAIAGFQLSVSAGENDFWDAALRYRTDWGDWQFRGGIGYMRDTDDGTRAGIGHRDRREWKGSASLMHTPSGAFLTGAFVNREFHGNDPSDQAAFGENTVGLVTEPGSNRPDLRYGYLKAGIRRDYTSLGDTKIYAEGAVAMDGITGLREAGPQEVTGSQLTMLGVGVVQDIDSAGMEVYLAARHFEFDVEGVRSSTTFGAIASPAPIQDIDMIYAGTRIKF